MYPQGSFCQIKWCIKGVNLGLPSSKALSLNCYTTTGVGVNERKYKQKCKAEGATIYRASSVS